MQSSSVTRATELLESSLFKPDDLPHTLEAVAREIGFDHFCLVHAELDNLTFIASELSLDALNAYADGGWREVDYRAANVNQTPDGQLFLDHLAVPDESRTRSAIYNELYVPKRMAYFAGWRFAIDGDTWIYSLARAEDKGPAGLAEAEGLMAGFLDGWQPMVWSNDRAAGFGEAAPTLGSWGLAGKTAAGRPGPGLDGWGGCQR